MGFLFNKLIWLDVVLVISVTPQKNILVIICDDLRPQLGTYFGDENFPDPVATKPITPNIDKLAAKSLVLKQAHVQVALCGPSRASFLTSRRPDTTKIYKNLPFMRSTERNLTTIPQYFKNQGYYTVGMGKIFHSRKYDIDNESWTFNEIYSTPLRNSGNENWIALTEKQRQKKITHDDKVLDLALKSLQNVSHFNTERPFLMITGFWKPHLPFQCPKEYFDMNPLSNISLPLNRFVPKNLPKYSWPHCEIYGKWNYPGERRFNATPPDNLTMELRRAYFSCVTYVDALVGELLDELKRLQLDRETIVVLIGDHGYHLAEHNMWCKRNNLQLGTHAPMIIHIPGMTDRGKTSTKLVEFVDLFPTLVEAVGFPPLELCPENSAKVELCTEGRSLMPLVMNRSVRNWKRRIFTQYLNRNVMGYSMRTRRFRYTEWIHFEETTGADWDNIKAVELFDHREDPYEDINCADCEQYSNIRRSLSRQLRNGWRAA